MVASGHIYVVQVRGNQPTLATALQALSQQARPDGEAVWVEEEVSRGSKKTWQTRTYACADVAGCAQWPGLSRAIVVTKTEVKQARQTTSTRYYITNSTTHSVAALAAGIRGHWGIENKLHRTRDVSFNQDKNRIKNTVAGAILCLFNTLAINFLLLQVAQSMTYAQLFFAQNFKEMLPNLST